MGCSMPNYFIQNKTSQRLYVPVPINRVLEPRGSTSAYVAASEMEIPAIRKMVTSNLLSVTVDNSAPVSDNLEVPVLSMIHGGGGAPTNATYLTLTANPVLTNERLLAVSGDMTTLDGGPNGNLTLGLSDTGVVAGVYGDGSSVPVVTVDAKGRVTQISTASNIAAHEGYDTLVHDLAESNYQEVSYASGFVSAITYWASSAKLLKLREVLFNYTPNNLVSSVVERQFDGLGGQMAQLVHTYSYNLDETLASISTVRT